MDAELLFYDGDCGLCHRAVRFVVFADRAGGVFRFAPIGGDTFRARVAPEQAAALPDSIVVERRDGVLLVRSDAMLHILSRLGGPWRVLARIAAVIPRRWRDAVYDGIARSRARLFRAPDAACPVTPPQLRARFDP